MGSLTGQIPMQGTEDPFYVRLLGRSENLRVDLQKAYLHKRQCPCRRTRVCRERNEV